MEGTISMNGLIRRALRAAIAAVMATAALAAPANAGILTASATNCDDGPLTKPFAPWGDKANYKLVKGGALETTPAGWSLQRGAKVVAGNEPWKVGGSSHGKSLLLPAGSSAITAPVCVGLGEPTLRFFAKKNRGLLTTLAVSVWVKTSLGLEVPLPIGVVLSSGQWKPSAPMLIVANLLPLLPGDRTPVAFQFTPLLGEWQIDDVYVDPMRSR
jgi:hypothetical protein